MLNLLHLVYLLYNKFYKWSLKKVFNGFSYRGTLGSKYFRLKCSYGHADYHVDRYASYYSFIFNCCFKFKINPWNVLNVTFCKFSNLTWNFVVIRWFKLKLLYKMGLELHFRKVLERFKRKQKQPKTWKYL